MIKKIKSRLSVKVFLITFLLMAACCSATYLCLAHFAPYIYSHKLYEAEEIADLMCDELSHAYREEAQYYIPIYCEILSQEYDNEYVFHIFQSSGRELALSDLEPLNDKKLGDYENTEPKKEYRILFADSAEEYILLLTGNSEKESQIAEALQKALPILGIVVFAVSAVAAFFYSWYMTAPIRKVSRLSKQMAEMEFGGLCRTARTDEIGVLSDSLNTLSQKLGTALSDLREANRKLQADIDMERRLERQRTEFFAAASHELKTPITIIKGQLQGMLYQVGRYKDRETYLAGTLETAETLEKMVQELLVLSRLDTPDYSCKKSRLDLSGLINECLAAYEDLFMLKELTVEKSIAQGVPVSGDRKLLQKVMDNLLGNAAAYSPGGNQIFVKLWQDTGEGKLTIENTGVHIPKEDIPKLFEAFYRVDRSRNRQTGGTGLGLYIVKTILDLHGAGIRIENTSRGVIVSLFFST